MRWKDTRWLLLVIFVLGFISCEDSLGHLGVSFLVLTVVDAAACALLLARLSTPLVQTLWAWIGLILLLDGYFARMYWFAYHINNARYINANYPELRWVTRARLLAGYPWASLGFVIFCLVAAAILTITPKTSPKPLHTPRFIPVEPWSQLVIGVFLAYLIASVLQIRLGYGVRGVANPSLPFRLGTVVTFFREEVVPSVLVLAVWVFDQRDKRWTNISLCLLFVSGIIDSFLSTSRGELLLFTVPIFALWGLTGRFTIRRKWALAAVLVTAAILVPIVSAQRVRRISGTATSAGPVSVETVVQSVFFLGERAGEGGIEAIWYALDYKGTPSVSRTVTYLRPYAFTRYYTYQIVGVRGQNDFRSSGMFGTFIIIGSSLVLVGLTVAIVGVIWGLWVTFRRLRVWPVALALASVTITLIITDPTGAILTVPKLIIEVTACELIYKRLTRPLPSVVPASAGAAHHLAR